MKKLLFLMTFIVSIFVLAGCQSGPKVDIAISNITPARTTLYFELAIEDEKEVIQENGVVAVLYYEGNELTRKAPVYKDGIISVIFEGLSVGRAYTFTVFATYDGKSHKMASGEATTTVVGGAEDNPKIITTIEDFNNIKNDLSAFYRLDADLDFGDADFQNTLGSNAFTGKFDGNGHTIRNLNMTMTTTYIGLFGYNKGSIKNLTIEDAHINYTQSTQNVGILAGKNSGTIENVTLKDSSVTLAYSRTGEIYVGGLVGLSESQSTMTNITIEDVAIDLNMSGRTEPYVGLLSGRAQGTNLTNIDASGTIDFVSTDTTYIGGLIGAIENIGTINASLKQAKANVNIVGDVNITSTLTNDAAMTLYVGGLVGANIGATLNEVFSNILIDLNTISNTSTNDSDDDEVSVGGIVGITTGTVKEAFAIGQIHVGQADGIVSFEKIYVGGLAGFQLGNKISNALVANMVIDVYSNTDMTIQASRTIGSELTSVVDYYYAYLAIDEVDYTGFVTLENSADVETIIEAAEVEYNGSLNDIFTSSFVLDILSTIQFTAV